MARRIRPHITLVHDAASISGLRSQLDLVGATCAPFAVRLTGARCWSKPAAGIYLAVEDLENGIETFRRRLGVVELPDVRYVPHVTLAHPRTVTAERAEEAWAELANWSADEVMRINTVAIVELEDPAWRTVATVALATT